MRGRRAPCPSFLSIGTRLTMLHRSLACKIWVSFLVLLLCACVGGRKDESGCRGTASKGHTGHGIPSFFVVSTHEREGRREAASMSGGQERSWQPTQRLEQHRTQTSILVPCGHVCPHPTSAEAERTRKHNGGGPPAAPLARGRRKQS